MTRYEVLKSLVKKWRDTTQSDFLTGDYRYGIGTAANELEAALALPEDSKTVNAELYGLAIELCDRYMRSEIESLCVNTGSTGFKLEARKPWYQDEVNEAVRYISLREASGDPMPYKVIRDGDKVRFL